jgi:hypothetical protein
LAFRPQIKRRNSLIRRMSKKMGAQMHGQGGERRAIRGQPFSFTQNGKRNSFVFFKPAERWKAPLSLSLSGRLCSTEFLPPLGSSSCGWKAEEPPSSREVHVHTLLTLFRW